MTQKVVPLDIIQQGKQFNKINTLFHHICASSNVDYP